MVPVPPPTSSLVASVAPNRAPSSAVHVKLMISSDVADVSEIVVYFSRGVVITNAGDSVFDGVFSQASGRYTAKLRVKVPEGMGAFSRLSLDLKAKTLFSLRSCPLWFRADLIGATTKRTVLHRAPCRD